MNLGYEWSADKNRHHRIAAEKHGGHVRPAL